MTRTAQPLHELLDSLPTNGNGKVDRKKLAALIEQPPATPAGSATAKAIPARLAH